MLFFFKKELCKLLGVLTRQKKTKKLRDETTLAGWQFGNRWVLTFNIDESKKTVHRTSLSHMRVLRDSGQPIDIYIYIHIYTYLEPQNWDPTMGSQLSGIAIMQKSQ